MLGSLKRLVFSIVYALFILVLFSIHVVENIISYEVSMHEFLFCCDYWDQFFDNVKLYIEHFIIELRTFVLAKQYINYRKIYANM